MFLIFLVLFFFFFPVLVKYSGYLEHMDKPFDSNCFRKTPRLMKLGEGKLRLATTKGGIVWGNFSEHGVLELVFLRSGFATPIMVLSAFPPEA